MNYCALPDRPRKRLFGAALTDLSELRPNDVVVHRQYGIGRYVGAPPPYRRGWRDFATIAHAGEDKLHVPFERFSVVQNTWHRSSPCAQCAGHRRMGADQGPVKEKARRWPRS